MKGHSSRTALLALAAATLVASGCYKHTYHTGGGAPAGTLVYDQWRHHWIAGLISPDYEMVLDEVCPSGRATIDQEMSFLNGLVGALTGGIYVPTTVKVRCASGADLDLQLSAESIEGMVLRPEFRDWVEAVVPDRLVEVEVAQDLAQDR